MRAVATAIALLFLFGPAVLWVGGVRSHAFENRPLASAPRLSQGWGALDALAPWASDHLPGREQAVRTNGWIDYFVFKSLPSTSTGPAGQAPTVVRGKNGYLFLGQDFDHACGNVARFRQGLDRFADLARLIESSGRKVVFAVGPNKSSVTTDSLPAVVPRGRCAAQAIARENRILDGFEDPRFVPVRAELARRHAHGEQVFWKTDTHWNPAGAAHYARDVAELLDPDLAMRVRLEKGSHTAVRDLITLAGLDFAETSPTLRLRTGATVTEQPGSDTFDADEAHYGINRWASRPAGHVVPGRSLLIGDSFTYFALGNLRPLFADGTFMWTGHVPPAQMVREIKRSDTVVIEIVQRSVAAYSLTNPAFMQQVARALGVAAH